MATVTRQRPVARKPINAKPARPTPNPHLPPKKGAARPKTASSSEGLNYPTPTTVLMYGPSGVGKTSLWAFLPDVGFLYDPKDEGIKDLIDFKQCPEPKWHEQATDFENTLELLANVANQEYDIKHLVIDSLTGFEIFCFQYHCHEFFEDDWSKGGFYAFQQGPKNAAKTDWPRFLDAMDDVRRAGISVIAIAHSQVKTFNNPDGANYDQHMPYLDKETWAQTHRWAKAVLFYNIEVGLEKGKGAPGNKAKVKAGTEERAIYSDPSGTFIAKNRWGLETRIDAGGSPEEAYNNFMTAYRKAAG